MTTTPPLPRTRVAGGTMTAVVTTGVGGYDRLVLSRRLRLIQPSLESALQIIDPILFSG